LRQCCVVCGLGMSLLVEEEQKIVLK
jgi:hypothetical protein